MRPCHVLDTVTTYYYSMLAIINRNILRDTHEKCTLRNATLYTSTYIGLLFVTNNTIVNSRLMMTASNKYIMMFAK